VNEARQQPHEHGAGLRLGKPLSDRRYGRGRGNFAQIHSAHTVGYGKQVAMRTRLLPRRWDERSHRVFIIGANLAEIRCLAELYIQHGRRRLNRPPQSCEENVL